MASLIWSAVVLSDQTSQRFNVLLYYYYYCQVRIAVAKWSRRCRQDELWGHTACKAALCKVDWMKLCDPSKEEKFYNNNSQNEIKLKSACAWWCHAPFVIRRIWQWRELIKAGLGKVVGVDIIVGQVQKVFSFYLIITFGDRFIIPQGGLIIIIIIRYYRSGTSTADE